MTTFKDPSRYGLALTLGGGESTMIEMSQAYTAFANEGVPKNVVSILKVEDKNGKTLYQFKDANYIQNIEKPLSYPNFLAISGKKAISKETAFLISHILLDNNARLLEFGPSSALVVPKHTVSVKTGTTDDKRDNWTIGYTPNFLTTVWVGNNDNSPMNQYLASGITGAAPIWNRIMQAALKNQPDLWPRKPDTVIGKQVCYISGAVMNKDAEGKESCPSRFEYFIKGTENVANAGYEQVKQQVPVNRKTGKLTTQEDPEHDMIEKTIIKGKDMFYCLDCNN
jgi:membrane carboxypeptidase/penicillin-binding protein